MSFWFKRALGPATAVVVSLSSVFADTELEAVYSEVIPASATLPDFSVTQVQVLSPSQFSDTAVTVADVIDQVPSVQIQQSGELGSLQSVTVRGAPSQQTQIYIDGVLQSSVGGEGNYLQQLSLTDIERIEVYPSSTPMQFNQATPGGAINIVRKKQQNTGYALSAQVGNFGRYGGSLRASGRLLNTDVSAFIDHTQAENDFTYFYDLDTSSVTPEGDEQTRLNAAFRSTTGLLTLDKTNENQHWSGALEAFTQHKALPNSNNVRDSDAFYEKDGARVSLEYDRNQTWLGLDASLRYQYLTQQGHFSDLGDDVGIFTDDSYDKLNSHQIQYHLLKPTGFGFLATSQSLMRDRFALENDLQGTTLDASRLQLTSSVGTEWFIDSDTTAMATGRHLWLQDEENTIRQSRQDWGLQFGIKHPVGPLTVQWNAQRSQRQPDLIERFGNTGTFVGNDELLPERSLAGDVSVSFQQDATYLNLGVFIRRADDAIVAVYNSQGIGRYVNLDRALYQGIEWQAATQYHRMQLESSGTLMASQITSFSTAYDGNQVPGHYPLSTTGRLTWPSQNAWSLTTQYRFEYGLFYDRANSTQAPLKHQWDAGLQWRRNNISLSFDATNLLNRTHQDYSRKPLPGRAFLLTLKIQNGVSS